MWIALEQRLRVVDFDQAEQGDRLFAGRRGSQTAMRFQDLGDLPAECQVRIEGTRGVLKDHGDPLPANRAKLARTHRAQIVATKADGAAALARVRGQQPHDGGGEGAFARAGLTDQAENFAGFDRERHVVQHANRSPVTEIIEAIVFDGEDRTHRPIRGLSASRRPSPTKLKPIAVRAIAAPGATIIHGA